MVSRGALKYIAGHSAPDLNTLVKNSMFRPLILSILIALGSIAFGWMWHTSKEPKPVQATTDVDRRASSDQSLLPSPTPPTKIKKTIQEIEREREIRLAEHDRKGAEIFKRLEESLPMTLTQLSKDVAVIKVREYELFFATWHLPEAQLNQVLDIIKHREQTEMMLIHESIKAGRSTDEGLKITQKLRSAQATSAASIRNIIGPELAQELDKWEKEKNNRKRTRLRD